MRTSAANELWVCELGLVPYLEALDIQASVCEQRQAGAVPDVLLLLEHPPVYTRGRRSKETELNLGEAFYREKGIEIVATDRGGRVTYHGPGQLVGYPIMAVRDISGHLRTMELAIVNALEEQGISARSRCKEGPDYTGVWVEERKIASIGVHVSRGVSTHGFAVNVENDLEPFSWIVACGLPDVSMTSIQSEQTLATQRPHGRASGPSQFSATMSSCFAAAHGMHRRAVSPDRLGIGMPAHDARMVPA